jgi:hypothetical protein
LKTEFGFDVVQISRGRYASDAYRDFIGFEVSKPLLETAFRDTYGLELKDVFGSVDLALGSYRWIVSSLIPKMTKIAWDVKKDEIAKSQPGATRKDFLYSLSRTDYEKAWGTQYRKPGVASRILAGVIRILPKIGPLRALQFRTPTPAAEKLFADSVNATVEQYRTLLAAERSRGTRPADVNLDIGEPTSVGMYKLADEAYAKLVHKWAERDFAGVPPELRDNILAFYKGQAVPVSSKENPKLWAKLQQELEALRGTAAGSRQLR